MGSLKSGLFAIAIAGLIGTAAVVGCSADGGGVADTTDPTAPVGSGLPPSSSGDVDSGKDSGKKDSGPKVEAGVDAGPPPPVEGTPCPTIDAKATKPCGACGKATTLCINDGTGAGKWGVYGVCGDELAGGCVPGATAACGNCGTQTCTASCGFGSCVVPPAAVCQAGALDYTDGSCTVPSTYRKRTCSSTCAWGAYSTTCAAPINEIVLNIGAAALAVTTKAITLTTARMASRLDSSDSCPQATPPTAGDYSYQYVELHNPTAKAAMVTVYNSATAGGVVIDTIMAAYSAPVQPITDNARQACRDGVNDQSSSDVALTGDANFAILKGVAIPAGGSILVYVGAYYENIVAAKVTTGTININTKVESLL